MKKKKSTLIGSYARFFVPFKDDFSSFCDIQLLRSKFEVPEAFKKFNVRIKAESGYETKILRSDGGGEYSSKGFKEWPATAGIAHQTTPPYTSQMNGVAERVNRAVVESARSQMYGKRVPLKLWGLAVLCAEHVQNRVISNMGK